MVTKRKVKRGPIGASVASIRSTPVFARISTLVGVLGLYATMVVLVEYYLLQNRFVLSAGFHAFLGLVLGSLLGFRTNTSYERWWEGRKLWGQLVNDSRNLAIKTQSCVSASPEEKARLGETLVAFAYALNDHLKGLEGEREFRRPLPVPGGVAHRPAYFATKIYEQLEDWRRRELLGGFELLFLDHHAASLMNICGACERIQKSPISVSYRRFFRQMIAVYLLTLPWGLIKDFGFWTVPCVLILSYFVIGLEAVAEEIEDPFGDTLDDLQLDELCHTIETSVNELLAAPAPS